MISKNRTYGFYQVTAPKQGTNKKSVNLGVHQVTALKRVQIESHVRFQRTHFKTSDRREDYKSGAR